MLRKIKHFLLILGLPLLLPNSAFAASNWLGINDDDLRNGNLGFESIPGIILNVTNFILGLVGTVATIMIIYGAVRIGYGAVADDKEAGKKIVTAGIVGFVISVSGWFIINFIIDNF
jgi:hypothetical protein